MPSFMPDTSCVVPLFLPRHEHHLRAVREVGKRLDHAETLVLAGPSLIEAYSVLTHLPAPDRLSARDCRYLIEANFPADRFETVVLTGDDYRRVVREAPDLSVSGGRIYDWVIASCALRREVDALVTFNERHFAMLASRGVAVVVPA
jgi:predicted nucleic acid-binding protein